MSGIFFALFDFFFRASFFSEGMGLSLLNKKGNGEHRQKVYHEAVLG